MFVKLPHVLNILTLRTSIAPERGIQQKAHSTRLGEETKHIHLSYSCLAAYTISDNKFTLQRTIKNETSQSCCLKKTLQSD